MAILDSVSSSLDFAFSTYLLRTAYSGQCLRVKRPSDNTELDIGFSSAECDWAAAAAFGANLKVITLYDQSGAANHKNFDAGYEPTLDTTLKGVSCNNHGISYGNLSSWTEGEVFFYSTWDENVDIPTGIGGYWNLGEDDFDGGTAHYIDRYEGFGTTVRKAFSWNETTYPLNAHHIYNVYSAASDWKAFYNSTQLHSTTSNTVAFQNTAKLFRTPHNGYYFKGLIRAFLLFSQKVATGERSSLQVLANYEPPPLDASFTLGATSYNYGQTVSATDNSTGGSGTKTRVWKIDGVTTVPSNGNYTAPTFAGLAAGLHTIRLDVTDDSGTDYFEASVFIGTVSGAASVANSATATYTTNVSSPTWSVLSGSGSINSSTGVFTAPSSGSGQSTIRAINGANFATKTIIWGFPRTVALGNVTSYTSTGLLSGTSYRARVVALDAQDNESEPSNWVTATTD